MLEAESLMISERSILSTGRYVHFGPFQVDQKREEVTRNGCRLKLRGKAYQALILLLEKAGEVVTREELRMRLWPAGTYVKYDASVNWTVNKLRHVLGDSSDNPLYIETLPRYGYSLMVRPEVSDKGVTAPLMRTGGAEDSNKPAAQADSRFQSRLWIIIGIIGLILAGMLLGAGITLWINR